VKPDRRSPLAMLWPALGGRFAILAAPPPLPRLPPARPAPLVRLLPGWRPAEVPAAVPVAQLPAAYLASETPEFSWVRETQRHIGTVVHGWLARLAQNMRLPSAAAIEEERPRLLAQLRRLGVPEREQGHALQIVLDAVRLTLGDERGRWILAGGHREAHSEWELSGVTAGRLRSVKIDRCFLDEDGTRWVIDFKTSTHQGAGLEAFLDQELERYRPQLEGYATLARALGPQPVRAALYFPLLGAFRELS